MYFPGVTGKYHAIFPSPFCHSFRVKPVLERQYD